MLPTHHPHQTDRQQTDRHQTDRQQDSSADRLDRVDRVATEIAELALAGELPAADWTHWSFVLTTVDLVRRHGPAGALDALRGITREMGLPCIASTATAPHETLTVFYVWAVDRLLDAGLPTTKVLWHPLVDARAPLAWYELETLRRTDAYEGFVPSDRALPGEPAPAPPTAT